VLPPEERAPLSAAQERARKVRASYAEGPLVRIAAARNQPEAELLQGLLLEEGIPSMVRPVGRLRRPRLPRLRAARRARAAVGEAAARDLLRTTAPRPRVSGNSRRRPWVRAPGGRARGAARRRRGGGCDRRHRPVIWIRYVLPAALVLAGFVVLFVADGSTKWDGFAMCVGAGLAVLLLNVLVRFGATGDEERTREEAAREYMAEHGHWPTRNNWPRLWPASRRFR
jgi:hypothetical protein